jgi:hypothetical protein
MTIDKVIVQTSGSIASIYDLGSKTAEEIAAASGVTDPDEYLAFDSADFDPVCYNFPTGFSLSGGTIGFDLATAKVTASTQEKSKYASLESAATAGYSTNQLASQSSLAAIDRLPEIQAVLDAVNTLATELSANLAAIDSATTVEEVNNIVNPPTGILFTGRGAGIGPEDLNVSYYTEWNSASMPESDTELYVPGTDTVIAYDSGGPGQFDSFGDCFNPGDYLMQIRETATSTVIAELEVPLNPAGENVSF